MLANNVSDFQKGPRRVSKSVQFGPVLVGGDAPIRVEFMPKINTCDVGATVRRIRELEEFGCELVRVDAPNMEAVQAITAIKRSISIPLIALLHYDYRLALAALEAGADGLRINPGNIGGHERVAAIVRAAKERDVPIVIGINAGSLPKGMIVQGSVAEQMVSAAMETIRLLESLDFDLIEVSFKAFDVMTVVEAYRMIAQKMPYPLYLGITEACLPQTGAIRSALGIGILLYHGIGDIIGVTLLGHPRLEIQAACDILKNLGLRPQGATLVSCPYCDEKCQVGLTELTELVENVGRELSRVEKPIKVAVMGCIIDGPLEAREADIGIACGKGSGVIFKRGKVVSKVPEKDYLSALLTQIEQL